MVPERSGHALDPELLLDALDAAPVAIALLDVHDDRLLYANRAFQDAGRHGASAPGDRPQRLPVIGRDGAVRALLLLATTERSGGHAPENAAADVVAQKELLLQEVNHRVKNSLQMVSALLGMQARGSGDATTQGELSAAARRVQAIASLHERLYAGDDGVSTDFRTYLLELCDELAASSPSHRCRVEAEPVELAADTAVRLGLAFVELVTNAIKHAAPPDGNCTIDIRFGPGADGRLELSVRDYGIGLPPDFELGRGRRTVGMRVIRGMAVQLNAELQAENAGPGARWTIRLPTLAS